MKFAAEPVSIYKRDFPDLEDRVYLNTGAEGILLQSFRQAVGTYFRVKSRGAEGRPELYEAEKECERKIARLLGVCPEAIALVSSASEGINRLCNSIAWQPGKDEVVIDDLEFPSNVLPWLKLSKSGVKVHIVRNRKWDLSPDDFQQHINQNTRLVSISHVSYMNGLRFDITELGKLVHSVGGVFCVDATQSVGRIRVPMEGIDYLVSSTYKWLLGPHGCGVVYCNQGLLDELEPSEVGWWSVPDIFSPDRFDTYRLKPDAAKMELGMPNFLAIYALNDALDYLLNIGITSIESQLQPVCDHLVEELEGLGVDLITPRQPEKRAGIISFLDEDGEGIAKKLLRQGIHVWGGDGRVRVSVHLYNDHHDIERLIETLSTIDGVRKKR
jgi:selenocysteine lyase/cysteine desulfurase